MQKKHMKNHKRTHSSITKRKASSKKYPALLLLLLVLTIPAVVLLTTKVEANAKESAPTYKYYTSIQVEGGDTLWDIAKEYRTDEYPDISSYIKEVKDINHLNSSRITDGMYLCIPYYTSDYKS